MEIPTRRRHEKCFILNPSIKSERMVFYEMSANESPFTFQFISATITYPIYLNTEMQIE